MNKKRIGVVKKRKGGKKLGKWDKPFRVVVEYRDHPVWEKALRQAPAGYIANG